MTQGRAPSPLGRSDNAYPSEKAAPSVDHSESVADRTHDRLLGTLPPGACVESRLESNPVQSLLTMDAAPFRKVSLPAAAQDRENGFPLDGDVHPESSTRSRGIAPVVGWRSTLEHQHAIR